MPRIHQLDSSVVNKIAAGEVIERPANVVKELLENSLDALASRIEIDIEAGGGELIRIVDDGEGIHPDDLLLAVTAHATSKIATADDLFRVQTMGFRGEALASIAEVSRMRIRSRQPDATTGFEIASDCGQITPPQPCGCPIGTQIEVRQLFANTPVRRKFLKSTGTEFAHIAEHFSRIALAQPRLHLVLRHNGKVVFELPGTQQLLDRIRLLLGNELAGNLLPVESQSQGVRMWGYVAHPSVSKSTRKSQHLFLNGRWIQDRSLQHALTESYRGLLMIGRQPIAFLFLEVPADIVDVNVHPTKTEVRFADSQALFRQLLSMLRTKFLSLNFESTMHLPPSGGGFSPAGAAPRPRGVELQAWSPMGASGSANSSANGSLWSNSPRPQAELPTIGTAESQSAGGESEISNFRSQISDFNSESSSVVRDQISEPAADLASFAATDQQAGESLSSVAEVTHAGRVSHNTGQTTRHGELRAMQIRDTYIVVETDEGLTLIDQHALHERIMYEYLRPRVLDNAVESQRMLVPETVELTPKETALLLEYADVLSQLGLGVQEFGRQTVLIDRYPVMLKKANLPQLVRDLAEQLDQPEKQPDRRDLLDSLLHMMSCKAAIKAGQRLSPEEIDSLLAQRHLIDDAHHCPHGRPTALVLTENELERQFGRLG
ncbi:MAG: DNA mismatch repair endonuclease MutL [Planctomycetaceae bacterium]